MIHRSKFKQMVVYQLDWQLCELLENLSLDDFLSKFKFTSHHFGDTFIGFSSVCRRKFQIRHLMVGLNYFDTNLPNNKLFSAFRPTETTFFPHNSSCKIENLGRNLCNDASISSYAKWLMANFFAKFWRWNLWHLNGSALYIPVCKA